MAEAAKIPPGGDSSRRNADAINQHADLLNIGFWQSRTEAQLANESHEAGRSFFVTDYTGGATPVISDGTSWHPLNPYVAFGGDPGADRIAFWDESEDALGWLQLGTGLSFSTTTLTLDSDLVAIAALTTTAFGRGLLELADASAGRTTLGLVIGTDVQAFDADLNAIAALNTASFGRGLLELASASALRSTAGLVIGTDVQAYDADLTTFANNPLTSAELTQLQNINSNTLGTTQWAALASATGNFGTAAFQNTGTSGATVPLLNGNNTHSGTNNFTGGTPTVSSDPVMARGAAETATGQKTFSGGFVGPRNRQDTNYTLVVSDAGKLVQSFGGSGVVYTVPTNATAAIPTGAFVWIGTGSNSLSVTPAAGVTLYVGGTGYTTARTLSAAHVVALVKVDPNLWIFVGSGIT